MSLKAAFEKQEAHPLWQGMHTKMYYFFGEWKGKKLEVYRSPTIEELEDTWELVKMPSSSTLPRLRKVL